MDDVATSERYDIVARSLHWLTVALLVAQFTIAWTMPDVDKVKTPFGLIAWHVAIGTTILAVVLVRAGWRFTHREPAAPASLPRWLQFVSRATHVTLYALLVALPLLGWANASSRGWPVKLFGIIPLPPLSSTGSELGDKLGDVHQTIAIVLLVVIGLHVLGALYHYFIVRDRTLQRML